LNLKFWFADKKVRFRVEDLEGLLSTARNENEDLKQESKILRESLVHQQDEIKSLRVTYFLRQNSFVLKL
jgi:hypothetical protein